MNPILAFWIKVQPLGGSFGSHAWKAISQSSALAPSFGDDALVSRSASTYSWAFDYLRASASCLSSHMYWSVFYLVTSLSWQNKPVIIPVHDAPPKLKPSFKAVCAGFQQYPTRKVDAALGAGRLVKGGVSPTTPLQQSQQLLEQQDYIDYQIQPNPLRRNSKEWVPDYKKERIDKINYNNVFGGMIDASNNEIPTLPPPLSEFRAQGNLASSKNLKYSLIQADSLSSSTAVRAMENVESISLSSVEPVVSEKMISKDNLSPQDVICGRGGKANTHPGNVSFREEAKKLRSWYESSSKSEKFTISSFLVDIVRERGGKFLKRNPQRPGWWMEVDDNDVRKKASQALREGRKAN